MRKNLTTILPLAISLLLILLPPAMTGRLRMFAATPLRPVGEGRRMLAATVNSLLSSPSSEREAALVEENERLRGRIDKLRGQLSDAEDALDAYRAFRENRRRYGLSEGNVVGAAIIFKGGTGPLRRTVYIDRGSADGLSEGMPVVRGEALVGVVNAVGPAMSEVVVLGDPRLKIRAYIVSAETGNTARPSDDRAAGLLVGTRLRFIWQQVGVREGDVVLTSGYGRRFPRGLVIGHVNSLSRQRDDLHHLIEVAPAFDFEGIDRVLVLTDRPGEVRSELPTPENSRDR